MTPQLIKQKLQQAIALHKTGRLNEAAVYYREIIGADPAQSDALHYLGVIEASAGHLNEAKALMARSVAIAPRNLQFAENYATVAYQAGDFEAAAKVAEQGLVANADNPTLLYVGAVALFKLNRFEESLRYFDKLLARQPQHIEAVNERGCVLAALGRHEEALACFDRALVLNQQYPAAHLNKGNVYGTLKQHAKALAAYDRALAFDARLPQAWLGRGNVLRKLMQHEQSAAAYDQALILAPKFAEAWLGRGNLFQAMRRYAEALAAYAKALEIEPTLVEAWVGRGQTHNEINRPQEALEAFAKAIELSPSEASAWYGRARALRKLDRFDEAIASYDKVLSIDSTFELAQGTRLFAKLQACDWRDYLAECAEVLDSVRQGRVAMEPMHFLCLESSSADQLQCARAFSASNFPTLSQMRRDERRRHDRIRLAYVSSDLRDHPVGYLIAGLFESHDRARFEVSAISSSPAPNSRVQQRIRQSVEHFVDVAQLSDQQVAELIQRQELDVIVNLNGYTEGLRQGIFARRPAPIQTQYLGYAGTLGTNYFDYVLADRTVVPESERESYSEKIVQLPSCFMITDRERAISAHTPTRHECGLPEKAFVFCSFNSVHKITPQMFAIWMNVLRMVGGSVLWMSSAGDSAVSNLRREAQAAGVAPERLIFAKRVSEQTEHLARQRAADLFLDTSPYNAHSTAADALWAGLPILTCLSSTFAGRVAASLLNAVGLDELITRSYSQYGELAVRIAHEPEMLKSLKEKLARNRLVYPLFDTKRFVRNLELAYATMYERYQAGLAPEHLIVEEKN